MESSLNPQSTIGMSFIDLGGPTSSSSTLSPTPTPAEAELDKSFVTIKKEDFVAQVATSNIQTQVNLSLFSKLIWRPTFPLTTSISTFCEKHRNLLPLLIIFALTLDILYYLFQLIFGNLLIIVQHFWGIRDK